MRLIDGYLNQKYVVDKITINKWDSIKLARMAIQVGSVVMVVANRRGYPFLIEVSGNRIAFSKQIAYQIEVIPYV